MTYKWTYARYVPGYDNIIFRGNFIFEIKIYVNAVPN